MRLTGASSRWNNSSAIRAAISAPQPHDRLSSYATTTRFVFPTEAAIASQSYGWIVRRSITSASIPSSASLFAARRLRSTSAPYVTIVTWSPARAIRALPNGTMYSRPGYGERLYVWRYRCLCSR